MEDEAYTDEDREYDAKESLMDVEDTDPFADWFMPGYVTEMDYLNAQEADDYRDEIDYEF